MIDLNYLIDFISSIINIESINDSTYSDKEINLPLNYSINIYYDGNYLTRFSISNKVNSFFRKSVASFFRKDTGFTYILYGDFISIVDNKMNHCKSLSQPNLRFGYLSNHSSTDLTFEVFKVILSHIFKLEIRDKKISEILINR